MNIDDFCYMWRGKQQEQLASEHVYLLKPVSVQGQKNDHALLLFHGFSSSPAVYRQLIPLLPAYDAIVCPALPGHAESIAAFGLVKASQWVAAAEQACALLMKEYKQVDVLGLSLGGLLACHLSQCFNLHHLYLLAPALELQLNSSFALMLAGLLQRLGFKYVRNRAGNLCSERYNELTYRQLPIASVIEILTLIQQFHFIPPRCPTDLFLGRFDKVVNSIMVEKRFAGISTTTIHWLEHSAHVLPLDSDVDTIAACLQQNFAINP
jgi:carboxylesterase